MDNKEIQTNVAEDKTLGGYAQDFTSERWHRPTVRVNKEGWKGLTSTEDSVDASRTKENYLQMPIIALAK